MPFPAQKDDALAEVIAALFMLGAQRQMQQSRDAVEPA
jgi:hypothetical protein